MSCLVYGLATGQGQNTYFYVSYFFVGHSMKACLSIADSSLLAPAWVLASLTPLHAFVAPTAS